MFTLFILIKYPRLHPLIITFSLQMFRNHVNGRASTPVVIDEAVPSGLLFINPIVKLIHVAKA